MRIVVSGSHATGKSTLVSDFWFKHPHYQVLPDPFDLVDDVDPTSAASFRAQLSLAAERLVEFAPGADVIVERGPIDFLAYLAALETLRRVTLAQAAWALLRDLTENAMAHVDLLVVLPVRGSREIWVPDEEDRQLRTAMDEHLLELCDDDELVGRVGRIIEVAGPADGRLASLTAQVNRGSSSGG